MAVNKNFVVKNGFEVNNNLILADANTNKVGIGTTQPGYTLDVAGGIGVTNLYVAGISTFIGDLKVGSAGTVFTVINVGGGTSVGVGTNLPRYLLDVRSPVSTGQTALYVQGDVKITGDLSVDDITFDDATLSNLEVTEALFVSNSGLSTFTGYVDINNSVDISNNLNVVGLSTLGSYVDINNSVDISGNLEVHGNLSVGGTIYTINSQDVYISNKDIILGFTTTITPDDDTANHAGIAIASTEGTPLSSFAASGINTLPDTYKQLMWFKSGTLGFSTDTFAFNYGVAIGTTTMANGVRLAVGSSVTITDTTVNAVSFVGDGSNLTGIATGLTGTIGVGSESTFVGSGVTEIYFATTTGTNVSVVSSGTSATVTITPGVSLGLAIALGG